MSRYLVARVGEIPEGGRKLVQLGGLPVGVFHVGGEYYAILNRCPHQAAPLAEGHIWSGLLTSEVPGQYVNQRDVPILSCIWHGWEFDLRTGQSVCDPNRLRVRNYDVRVTKDCLPNPATAANRDWEHAMTFLVEANDDWIVVDLDRRPAGAASRAVVSA